MNYNDGYVNNSLMVAPRYTLVPTTLVRDRVRSILEKNQPNCYEIYNGIIEYFGGIPFEFSNITKFASGDMVFPDNDFCVIDLDFNSEPVGNLCNYELTILLKIALLDRENKDSTGILSLAYLESWLMIFQTINPLDLFIRDQKDGETIQEYGLFKMEASRKIGNPVMKSFLFQKGDEYIKGVKGSQSVLKLDIKGQTLGRPRA